MVRTMKGEQNLRSSNSCVGEEYKERGNALEVGIKYGRVKNMFIHKSGADEEIIVECDWYERVGINPRTKLTQIKRNLNYEGCRVAFLKNLFPSEMVFWPMIPTLHTRTMTCGMIRHHE